MGTSMPCRPMWWRNSVCKRCKCLGCCDQGSSQPRRCAFSAELPWHGDPPPSRIAVISRRCKTGMNSAPVSSSTVCTCNACGKCCWKEDRICASCSAEIAMHLMPRASNATSNPPMPDHMSTTRTSPLQGCAHGNCGSSPCPRQVSCFAAYNWCAMAEVCAAPPFPSCFAKPPQPGTS